MIDADRIRHRLRYREAQCLARPARDGLRDLLADAADALDALLAERDALRRQVAGARAFVDEYFERGDGHNLMVCLRSCLAASTSDTEPEARR